MSTDTNIYRKLQQYLDTFPVDHPETESGVEIRILKHLYTPEEAEIALKLTLLFMNVKSLYRKFKKKGWTRDEFHDKLLTMAKKGTISWVIAKDGSDYFRIMPLVIGSFDYQVNRLTKEFAQDFDQYCDEGFISSMMENGMLQVRTIPIEKSIPFEYSISNYDHVRKLIENAKTFVLSPCICRQSKDVQGIGCNHPKETCLTFDPARVILQQGREISKDEALDFLQMVQDEGLVLSPTNSQQIGMLCACCGCSCMILENLKKYINPSQFVDSNYFVTIDESKCKGCGTCIQVCHMEANYMKSEGISTVNLGYCIGCGVCVSKCSQNARALKPKEEKVTPPEKFIGMYQIMAKNKAEIREKRKIDPNFGRVERTK